MRTILCAPQVAYKNIEFMVWDMGGQDAIRQLWSHYYKNAQALIFVVDSADEERLAEAREELQKLMGEEVRARVWGRMSEECAAHVVVNGPIGG